MGTLDPLHSNVRSCGELDQLKNYPNDGRKRIMILTDNHVRAVLVPQLKSTSSKFLQVQEEKIDDLLAVARKPTVEQKKNYIQSLNNEILKKECYLAEKNKWESDKVKPSKSELKLLQKERLRKDYLKKRAEALMLEEEDAMKLLNSEIMKVKCSSIIKKQMQQKNMKEKLEKNEDKKVEKKSLEENEYLLNNSIAQTEKQKQESRRTYIEILQKQMEEKANEKSLKQKEMQKEAEERILINELQRKKDFAEMVKKKDQKLNLLKNMKDSLLAAQILKAKQNEEEKITMKKLEEMRRLTEKREGEEKENLKKKRRDRNEVYELLDKQLREKNALITEAEEFARKRKNDEVDREWRQKEKEKILTDLNRKKNYAEEIQKHKDGIYKEIVKIIAEEIKEAEEIENIFSALNEEKENQKKNLLKKKRQLVEYGCKQITEKAQIEQAQKLENKLFAEKFKKKQNQRKEILKRAMEDKIEELASHDVEKDLIKIIQTKANIIREKDTSKIG